MHEFTQVSIKGTTFRFVSLVAHDGYVAWHQSYKEVKDTDRSVSSDVERFMSRAKAKLIGRKEVSVCPN